MSDHVPGSDWSLTYDLPFGHQKTRSSAHLGDPTVFDELVVDRWLHVEQMDDDEWSILVHCEDGSQVLVFVAVGPSGMASDVLVEDLG